MKRLPLGLAAAFLLIFASSRARAQVVPAAVGPGAYVAVGAGVSDYQSDYGQLHLPGGMIYVDVHPQWRIGFEGEARMVGYHNAENIKESTYLGGPHITLMHWHHIDPYAKFLVGMGRISLPFGYAHGSFLALAPGIGVDYALNHYVSLRVIDVEYQHWENFPYGSLNPLGISAGVRIRVSPVALIPHRLHKGRVRYQK